MLGATELAFGATSGASTLMKDSAPPSSKKKQALSPPRKEAQQGALTRGQQHSLAGALPHTWPCSAAIARLRSKYSEEAAFRSEFEAMQRNIEGEHSQRHCPQEMAMPGERASIEEERAKALLMPRGRAKNEACLPFPQRLYWASPFGGWCWYDSLHTHHAHTGS